MLLTTFPTEKEDNFYTPKNLSTLFPIKQNKGVEAKIPVVKGYTALFHSFRLPYCHCY